METGCPRWPFPARIQVLENKCQTLHHRTASGEAHRKKNPPSLKLKWWQKRPSDSADNLRCQSKRLANFDRKIIDYFLVDHFEQIGLGIYTPFCEQTPFQNRSHSISTFDFTPKSFVA